MSSLKPKIGIVNAIAVFDKNLITTS